MRKADVTSAYYSLAAGSVGPARRRAAEVDLQDLHAVHDAHSLQNFEASEGWTAGAEASVAPIDICADVRVDSKCYVMNNQGFVANLRLNGTNFTRMSM